MGSWTTLRAIHIHIDVKFFGFFICSMKSWPSNVAQWENKCLSPNPNTLSFSLACFPLQKSQKKAARSDPVCSRRRQHTMSCIMRHVRPESFLCVLMRHHEGMLRVKIHGGPVTYSDFYSLEHRRVNAYQECHEETPIAWAAQTGWYGMLSSYRLSAITLMLQN